MTGARVAMVAVAGAALAACAGAPGGGPAVRTVTLPTPIACRADVGAPPGYPDTDGALRAAPDLFARVRLLAAGRLLRMVRERELMAALDGCAGP